MGNRKNTYRPFLLLSAVLLYFGPAQSVNAANPPLSQQGKHRAGQAGLPGPMINASMTGNVEAVRQGLNSGWPINRPFESGETLLINAAGFGHSALVRLLLSRGAAVNPRGLLGRTALWNAASADLAQTTSGPSSPTPEQLQAQAAAYLQILQMLLAHGANPNIADDDAITPLDVAAFRGRTPIVAMLLQARTDPNRHDRYGRTPTEWAAYEGHPEIVQMLRAHGARVNPRHGLPGPPQRALDELLVAALMKQPYGTDTRLSEIKALLERGADPNAYLVQPNIVPLTTPPEMQDLTTPFLLAGAPKTFALMLAHGANADLTLLGPDPASTRLLLTFDARKHGGHAAHLADRLLAAAERESPLAQMKTLLAYDQSIRVPRTAFFRTRSEAALALLLAQGANINARDQEGRTQLMQVADEHYGEGDVAACEDVWARILLKHGADPNRRDHDGITALMLLSAQGEYGDYNSGNPIQFARLLLSHGAMSSIRNKKGQTALQIAERSGAKSLVRLLRRRRRG